MLLRSNCRMKTKQTNLIREYAQGISKNLQGSASSSTISISLLEDFFTTPYERDSSMSMISETPWTEQSWDFEQYEQVSKKSSYISWLSEPSVSPKLTTSSGRSSRDVSMSNLTVTILSCPASNTESLSITVHKHQPASPNPFQDIDGLSIWTVETYTSSDHVLKVSTGLNSQSIRVKYPWSPITECGTADITTDYPSSMSLMQLRRSEDTVAFRSDLSVDTINWLGPSTH